MDGLLKSFYTRAYLLASVLDLRRGKILENVRRHSRHSRYYSRDRKLDFSHDEPAFRDDSTSEKETCFGVRASGEVLRARHPSRTLEIVCRFYSSFLSIFRTKEKKKKRKKVHGDVSFRNGGNHRSCTRSRAQRFYAFEKGRLI